MKKASKWLFGILGGLIFLCLLLAVILFEKVDRTPYRETPYYKKMSAQLDAFQFDTSATKGQYFKAGWAKVNITPNKWPELAGYGIRDKATCLHDSVFARAFVFENGKKKVAFISLDLLIFPPEVTEKLYKEFEKDGYASGDLYFSATHTHSAPGGWAKGLAGNALAGDYDEAYVTKLILSIIKAVKKAEKNLEPATISYTQINAANMVRNRLNMADSEIDPWVRLLKIDKTSGKKACMVVYSAHANCLKIENTCISGDYPARLIENLEGSGKVDFAMYAAGMVGSHIPTNPKELEEMNYVNQYADSLSKIVIQKMDSTTLDSGNSLATAHLNLYLRAPHLKVLKNWRVKPWVFDWLFGDYYPKLKILKINNIVFIGTPCDFSGELMKYFDAICEERKIKLVITSFNGGYIGYINVDKYYDENKAETRDMNWFGPYNQAYFTEVIQRILKKI